MLKAPSGSDSVHKLLVPEPSVDKPEVTTAPLTLRDNVAAAKQFTMGPHTPCFAADA